jgi:hypothetical protein
MADIRFNSTLTFNGNGSDILNPLISDIFDADKVSFEINNDVAGKMGFKETRAITPDQKFRQSIGAYELTKIGENEDFPIMQTGFAKEKGFYVDPYAAKIQVSKLFKKWMEAAQTLQGADSSVQKEWMELGWNIRSLRYGVVKTANIAATEVLTKGFSIVATNGAGSATAYGQALFSASHPYGVGMAAGTFQNVLGGGTTFGTLNGVLNAANLQGALNVMKTSVRLQNGDRVDTPSKYILGVSRANAVTARGLLNTAGNQVGMYAGTAANSTLVNTFSYQGNTVEILELPYLGGKKSDGSPVGLDTMWFLMNAEGAEMAGALRKVSLYDAEFWTYTNDSNKMTYVTVDMAFAIDHFGAEAFIVGSQWTV